MYWHFPTLLPFSGHTCADHVTKAWHNNNRSMITNIKWKRKRPKFTLDTSIVSVHNMPQTSKRHPSLHSVCAKTHLDPLERTGFTPASSKLMHSFRSAMISSSSLHFLVTSHRGNITSTETHQMHQRLYLSRHPWLLALSNEPYTTPKNPRQTLFN